MVGVSAALLIAATVQGAVGDIGMLSAMAFTGIAGGTMFATSALRLPRWARTRQQQMEDVAARVALSASSSLPDSD